MEIPKGKSVLVFAGDSDTKDVFDKAISGEDVNIRKGTIADAIKYLAENRSSELVIVDLANVPHPMGSIYALAEVCEFGTKVFAIGPDNSASLTRELFQNGVSDYLSKPLVVSKVREAIRGLLLEEQEGEARAGRVASFMGCGGGVGVTTLTCLTALEIARRGGYVALLDLSREGSTVSVLFEKTIPAGLGEVMDQGADVHMHTETLDGAKVMLSDRIALYAYPLLDGSDLSPVPSADSIEWLLTHLSHHHHIVLVDGLSDLQSRQTAARNSDVNVLIYECAFGSIARMKANASLLGLTEELEEGRAMVLAECNTRSGKWVLQREHMEYVLQGRNVDATFPYEQSILKSPDPQTAVNLVQKQYKVSLHELVDHVWGKADSEEKAG